MQDFTGPYPQFGNSAPLSGAYMPAVPNSFDSQGQELITSVSQPNYMPTSSDLGQAHFSMPYDAPNYNSQNQPQIPRVPSMSPSSKKEKVVHSCSYCGLVLSSANALVEHTRIHTGDRPFACTVCGKRFTQKAHLNIHKRTHTGEKPYACNICHKRFAQSSHLTSHRRIHSDEKPFVCGICQAGFTQKQRLDVHLKKHLEQNSNVVRRSSSIAATSLNSKVERQFRSRAPKYEDNMMQMMSHGMQYVKQEPDLLNSNFGSSNVGSLNNNKTYERAEETELANQTKLLIQENNKKEHDADEGEGISNPSFTSEGMFLHPSGYVSYGGREDEEDVADVESEDVNNGDETQGCNSNAMNKSLESQLSNEDTSRSKGDENSTNESKNIVDNSNSISDSRQNTSPNNNLCEINNMNTQNRVSTPSNNSPHIRSQGQRINGASGDQQMNHGENMSAGQNNRTLSYAGPGKNGNIDRDLSSSGLFKVNNRISLVNFTAEELISHLMKRDDVHKCEFCCLIFQDAAMYHIHRNMHDKQDVRLCNMCGKMLHDKYDFTAHFLSMHQS